MFWVVARSRNYTQSVRHREETQDTVAIIFWTLEWVSFPVPSSTSPMPTDLVSIWATDLSLFSCQLIARLDLGLLARPLSLPSLIHPSFPVLPGTQNDLIHWVENAIKLCWKKQSNGFSNYFLRRFSALGVILAVILRMGLSIAGGWALCPDHGMHPANTYTIPAPGRGGRVGFNADRVSSSLPLLCVCGEQGTGHRSHTILFFKLLFHRTQMKEGVCVCVCSGPYTHAHSHGMLCYFKSASFLPSSVCGPSSLTARGAGVVGVLSRVAGADGGRAGAQVPAVADTGGETDEDGHWALCSGEVTSCPLENWAQTDHTGGGVCKAREAGGTWDGDRRTRRCTRK